MHGWNVANPPTLRAVKVFHSLAGSAGANCWHTMRSTLVVHPGRAGHTRVRQKRCWKLSPEFAQSFASVDKSV